MRADKDIYPYSADRNMKKKKIDFRVKVAVQSIVQKTKVKGQKQKYKSLHFQKNFTKKIVFQSDVLNYCHGSSN